MTRNGSIAGTEGRTKVTIADVARAAGVSKSAVSYVFNDRPGVSAATRERILSAAAQLNWEPNAHARSMIGRRSGLVGLALNRPAEMLGSEPFFMEFVSGVEQQLCERDMGLVFQLVRSMSAECELLTRWARHRTVAGVIMMEFIREDPRIPLLRDLGLPSVAVVDPAVARSMTSVWTSDGDAVREAVRYLVALGHQRIVWVAGPTRLVHANERSRAFHQEMARLGIVDPVVIESDYSQEQGTRATRLLLSQPERPTAIIYDNDVMAVAGLSVAREMGVRVPGDLSIIAWDDSLLCRLTYPALTALSHDIPEFGRLVTSVLLGVIDGKEGGSSRAPSPALVVRGSTGPPPGVRR